MQFTFAGLGGIQIASETSAVDAEGVGFAFAAAMRLQTVEKAIKTAFQTVDGRLQLLERAVDFRRFFRRLRHSPAYRPRPIWVQFILRVVSK